MTPGAALPETPTTVLLVDDEQDLLDLMKMSLGSKGYSVSISNNGDDLLDMVSRVQPDVILLDLQMQGIDGGTVCHLLRHNGSTSKIPILILSGNPDIQMIAESCGADAFVPKPFNAARVGIEIERLLQAV